MPLTAAQKQLIFPWLSRVEDATFFDMYRMTARVVQTHLSGTGQRDDFASVLVATDKRVRQAVGADVQTLANMLYANADAVSADLDLAVYYWAVGLNDNYVSFMAHEQACDNAYRRLTHNDVFGV